MDWATGTAAKENDETVQGSEAWLRWRGKGLGSSDAAVLLGWSPWKTIEQLYAEKLGLWKATFGENQQRAMDRGRELEPVIRAWYEKQIGALFPDATAEHPQFGFMRASFDGINMDYKNSDGSIGRIVEIKAPNKKDHELAKMDSLPEKYEAQVQWLMMVAGVSKASYVSYGTDDTYALVYVSTDKQMQEELIRRARDFWAFVTAKEPLDLNLFSRWERQDTIEPLERPIEVSEEVMEAFVAEASVEALVAEALDAKKKLSDLDAYYKALQEKLKKILGKNTEHTAGEGVFGFTERKGAVQYKNIPELIGLDLEQFRAKPVKVFFIKRIGEQE